MFNISSGVCGFMGKDRIELQTGSDVDRLLLSEFEKSKHDGDFKCLVTMRSSIFSCERPFIFNSLDSTIRSLEKMDRGISGEAELRYGREHEMLKFSMNPLGHVVVRGEFFHYGELEQNLKIAFRTDQTVLKFFIRDLKRLLEE